MINRIKELARYYGLSSTAFADQIEIPRPVISHIFSERNRPSLEVVQKIGLAFPDVDLDWLLYGKGEMLKRIAQPVEIPGEDSSIKEDNLPPAIQQTSPELTDTNPISQHPPLPAYKDSVSKKKAVKIVFIYDDNTFEEFYS